MAPEQDDPQSLPTGGPIHAAAERTARLESLVEVAHRAGRGGLVVGSAGNVSCRLGPWEMAISPTGWELKDLIAADLVKVPLTAGPGTASPEALAPPADGTHRKASSEWRLHETLYRARADLGAVVHTHSPYATALACLERSIPAVHYYLALLGGEVPLVPYAPYGSGELADGLARVLEKSPAQAALLAHHGAVTLGGTPEEALLRAEILEHLSQIYLLGLSTGQDLPVLTTDQLEEAGRRLTSYTHYKPVRRP